MVASGKIRKPDTDGRHLRSQRSRAKILDGLLSVLQAGDMDPSAETVARAAGVSHRTVLRHFEDMESIYRTFTERHEGAFLERVMQPLPGDTWQERLLALVDLRVGIFEDLMHIRVSAESRRFRSPQLQGNFQRNFKLEVAGVFAVLPPEVRAEKNVALAFENAICFHAWRRLRQDHGLAIEAAKQVVLTTFSALLNLHTSKKSSKK